MENNETSIEPFTTISPEMPADNFTTNNTMVMQASEPIQKPRIAGLVIGIVGFVISFISAITWIIATLTATSSKETFGDFFVAILGTFIFVIIMVVLAIPMIFLAILGLIVCLKSKEKMIRNSFIQGMIFNIITLLFNIYLVFFQHFNIT